MKRQVWDSCLLHSIPRAVCAVCPAMLSMAQDLFSNVSQKFGLIYFIWKKTESKKWNSEVCFCSKSKITAGKVQLAAIIIRHRSPVLMTPYIPMWPNIGPGMQFLCLFAALSWQHNQPPGEKIETSVKESKVSKQTHSEKWKSLVPKKKKIFASFYTLRKN